MSHSQARGAFCSSADVSIAYRYWVKHPVLLDLRPADCVTTSASNTGCFVMSAKNGKPCVKCGSNEWNKSGDCKPCQRERKNRWQKNNPEKNAAAVRRWTERNREKVAEKAQRWAKENPKRKAETDRQWKRDNPEKRAAQDSRRKTSKTKAGGSYSAAEWKALVEHCGGKCLCCGRGDIALTVDHIVPVAKGGTSNIDNIQPLCGRCNFRKNDKIIDYRPNQGVGRWIQKKLFGWPAAPTPPAAPQEPTP